MEGINRELLAAARNYQIDPASVQVLASASPLILCGVTAAGKNATGDYLESRSDLQRVVSHTTRSPRPGEVDGQAYWFVDEPAMLALVNQRQFVEVEVLNGDRVYGTSLKALGLVLEAGKRPMLAIDVQAAAKVANLVSGLKPLFMIPPSSDVWMQRLGGRTDISDGEHNRRLGTASSELELVSHNADFLIVINHDIEQSAREILQGVPSDSSTQAERRMLVKDLLEYARSSNI